MQSEKLKVKRWMLMLALMLALAPSRTHAARYIVETVSREGLVEAYVYFRPEGSEVNALQGKLSFPVELLRLERAENSASVVQLWVDGPRQEGNEILFSGVIPGGFKGTYLADSENLLRGQVLKAVFTPLAAGTGTIRISGDALLNDGEGTTLPVASGEAEVVATPSQYARIAPKDAAPPETFLPQLLQDAHTFGDAWVLAFHATDKQSGIAYYEVRERRLGSFRFAEWRRAESPYVLQDQKLTSFISVKAVDFAGNARIETLAPRSKPKWYTEDIVWALAGFAIFLLGVAWARRRRT